MALWTLPDFNETAYVWQSPNVPALDPVDFTIDCQLYVHTKLSVSEDTFGGLGSFIQAFIRCPYVSGQLGVDYVFEVPQAYGRYLRAMYGYRVHLGFPNEYLLISVYQCDGNGNQLAWQTW